MSTHAEQITLEVIAHMLGDVKAQQVGILQKIEDAAAASVTRDERMRGEIRSLRGEMQALAGKVESLAGTVITLTASVEALELEGGKIVREFCKLNQAVDGLTQLGSTNFDQNASILEAITGTKGADRPNRQSKPSGPSD